MIDVSIASVGEAPPTGPAPRLRAPMIDASIDSVGYGPLAGPAPRLRAPMIDVSIDLGGYAPPTGPERGFAAEMIDVSIAADRAVALGLRYHPPVSSRSRRGAKARRPARPRAAAAPNQPSAEDEFAVLGIALQRILDRGLQATERLADSADPLDSEVAASGLLALWSTFKLPGQIDAAGLLGMAMVDYLESRVRTDDSPEAMCLLLGFQAVGQAGPSVDAMLAVHRLKEEGVEPPPWAELAGRARLEHAWTATDNFGDHDFLVGRFSYQGRDPHDLGFLIDHNILHIVKDMAVYRSDVDLRAEWEQLQDIFVQDLSEQEFSDRLADALDMLDHTWDSPISDSARMLRPLVDSRRFRLRRSRALKRRPVSQAARDRLFKSFRASGPGKELGRDANLARLCIDYAADYHDDALRWSPIVVELFLTDWLPRKVSLEDEEVERLPDVLRAWLRFVAEQRGFEERHVGEMFDAVERYEAGFREAMADSERFGPAKSIARLMAADDVDFSDPGCRAGLDR